MKKIYLILIGLLVLIVAISEFISPLVIKSIDDGWEQKVKLSIENVESEVFNTFKTQENILLNKASHLHNKISDLSVSSAVDSKTLIPVVNSLEFEGYCIRVFDTNNKSIAWTGTQLLPIDSLLIGSFQFGETFFYDTELMTYLTLLDSVDQRGSKFYYSISQPFEKKYSLNNKYYIPLSFKETLSTNLFTSVEIDYNLFAERSIDGREFSFDLLNNFNNKIATVTFQKPIKDVEIIEIHEAVATIQSILILLILLLIGIWYYPNWRNHQSRILKLVLLDGYLIIIRVLLFYLKIPGRFLGGELVDSSNFSSTFAFGMVRSPLEFFISVFFTFVICVSLINFALGLLNSENEQKTVNLNKWLYGAITFFSGIFLMLAFRGFGASMRSVIYDSSLRYFKDPGLIPDLSIAIMDLNVLILSVGLLILSLAVVIIVVYLLPSNFKNRISAFVLIYVAFEFIGVLFDAIQPHPQAPGYMRIIFISFVFFISYLIIFMSKRGMFIYFTMFVVGSFFSINLLDYHNSEMERESLKLTAYELTHPNEELLEFMVYETILNAIERDDLIESFNNPETNFDAVAFKLWSKSVLHRESINCEIVLWDKDINYLGGYNFNIDDDESIYWPVFDIGDDEIVIKRENLNSDCRIVSGVASLLEEDERLGFITVTILNKALGKSMRPDFINSNTSLLNSVIDLDKIDIININSTICPSNYSDLKLNDTEKEKIINADFDQYGETWLSMEIDAESHIVFALKNIEFETTSILGVALKEKDISWNLFDFFKVFFVHALFMIFFLSFYLLIDLYRRRNFQISFKARLLVSFLIVSIIPMLLLAGYFRGLTEEKNNSAVVYKLSKRAGSIEDYLNSHLGNEADDENIYLSAYKDLNINYSLFDGKEIIFSTRDEYYGIGLFPKFINPQVYNRINNQGDVGFVVTESIDNYSFNAYYYNCVINDRDVVIKVSDAFNTISIPLSDVELDIFLFGSYSLAVILIILISTMLANQISSPILKLTAATRDVAHGDLGLELGEKYSGEINELVDSFNYMVKELNKSQKELAELERETAWKEMAKQVAHEIKNPLTPMKLSVQQLITAYNDKSPKLDGIFNKVTQTVISQIDTLRNIASEFSNFARMPNMNVEKVNAGLIAKDAANLFNDDNITIKFSGHSESTSVMADGEQLKRIFINLIRNSVQAEAQNIEIGFDSNHDQNLIRVTDDGKGISEDIIKYIFDKEFTTKEKGMGIGLSMVKKYVSLVDGSIEVEKTSGAGTTILIKFPKAD